MTQGTLYAACLVGGLGLWLWAPWKVGTEQQSSKGTAGDSSEKWVGGEAHGRSRRDVFGVVLDAQGLPVPGVRVEFRAPFDPEFVFATPAQWVADTANADAANADERAGATPAATAHSSSASGESQSVGEGAGAHPTESSAASDAGAPGRFASAITNAKGEFQLPGVPALKCGELHYGSDLFEGDPLIQPLQVGEGSQVLELPARPAETPLVRVRVVDKATGSPLGVDHLLLRLLRLPTLPTLDPNGSGQPLPRRALREPQAEQIRSGPGWAELELWPGSWRLELASSSSRASSVEFEVPRSGEPIEIEVELDVFSPNAGWEILAPVVDGELTLDPSSSNGFDEYAMDIWPQRPIGEVRRNLTFRHTLRFEPGEFAEAYLELELEAGSSMSYNDSLGLEFGIPPVFGFHQHLCVIVGEWRAPMHQRVFVDLSDMTGFLGPVNLLGELSDGELDIYVQDDTGVHDLRLYLRRK